MEEGVYTQICSFGGGRVLNLDIEEIHKWKMKSFFPNKIIRAQ